MASSARTRLALLLVACAATGCQTTVSGRAIGAQLGGSLRRLWQSPSTLLGGELARGRNLLTVANPARWVSPSQLGELVEGTGGMGGRSFDRLVRLPSDLGNIGHRFTQRAGTGLRAILGDENAGLRHRDRTGRLLGKLRGSLRTVPDLLGLTRSILPGPGDLDRTLDPFQVGRGLTWIERLLMRF